MTRVEKFMAANKLSPVVSGSAIGNGGQGARYTLKNGMRFILSADDCRKIGHPRWDLPDDPNQAVSG